MTCLAFRFMPFSSGLTRDANLFSANEICRFRDRCPESRLVHCFIDLPAIVSRRGRARMVDADWLDTRGLPHPGNSTSNS